MVFASVLVPLDGSNLAAKAIPPAAIIAQRFQARLILLRALSPRENPVDDKCLPQPERAGGSLSILTQRDYDAVRSQAEGYLDGMKRSLSGNGIEVETRLEEGDASSVIVQVAQCLDRPLVVITSSGKTASRTEPRSGVGEVARQVLQECKAPVLVIKT